MFFSNVCMQVKLVNILTYVPILSYENGILSHNSNRHAVQYKRPAATSAPMWVASLVYYLHCALTYGVAGMFNVYIRVYVSEINFCWLKCGENCGLWTQLRWMSCLEPVLENFVQIGRQSSKRCFAECGCVDSRPFRSSALSFPGAKSPQRELSLPWNFRSVGHSLLGTFAPVELSFLGSECSKNFRSMEHSLPCYFRSSGANVPRTFVPMKLSFHENEYSKNLRSKCPKTRPKLAINLTIAYAH